jgi:hypothetical protein
VCEIWSPTLREEQRLRVFEIRVLRRVFGPEVFEVAGEWKEREASPVAHSKGFASVQG